MVPSLDTKLFLLQDGEAEGYRAPMRTNYMDRLIDSPQVGSVVWCGTTGNQRFCAWEAKGTLLGK